MGKERPLIRYEKLSKEDLVDYCRVYWRRIHSDEVLFNEIYEDIENLKEENKKLKEMSGKLGEMNGKFGERVNNLAEENKKLKEERDIESKGHCQDMRELWKVENEDKCLKRDMEQYKEEKGKEILELKHFIFNLEEENKKLKADLRECECSMHFENDEVGYRKRECKKLKELVNEIHRDKEHILGEKLILQEENENMREEMKAMERTLDHLGYGERTY